MPLNVVFLRPQNWSRLKPYVLKHYYLPSRSFEEFKVFDNFLLGGHGHRGFDKLVRNRCVITTYPKIGRAGRVQRKWVQPENLYA